MLIKFILLVLFPLAVLLCVNYKQIFAGQYREKVLDIQDSYTIRGIAAFFVIFAHYTLKLKADDYALGICKPYTWLGGIGVCLFFFLSGYGVACSTLKKGSGTIGGLIKRLLKIFIPIVVLRVIFAIYELYFWTGTPEGSGLWYMLGIENGPWFLNELMIIYVIYHVASVIGEKKKGLWITVMIAGLLLMSVIFCMLGFPSRWYDSNAMFAAGMILALYKDAIISWLQKHYWLKAIVCGGLFVVPTVVYTSVKGDMIAVPLKILSGLALNFLFVMVAMRTQMRSKVLEFFGKRSLYMYLTHVSVWVILAEMIQNEQILFGAAFVISLILTVICFWIDEKIQKRIS